VPAYCIHPYEIDTSEDNIIREPIDNSIHFRINDKEFTTGEKRSELNKILLSFIIFSNFYNC
jgi:hypothetical protein